MIEGLDTAQHHPALEEIVDVLCNKTQNKDRGFFRTEVAYFLAKMASSMRATIVTKDRGDIPVNLYALALATSGFGKGYSVNIVEDQFLSGFKKRFMEDTFQVIADQHLNQIANDRSVRMGTDQQEEFEKVEREFRSAGAYPFTFDSGTPPAVKQLRHKLLLSNIGSINLQIDEIGSNLIGSTDVLNLFLELYDQGIVKQKLVKNTQDNTRGEEVDGKTPTNMLLFGTPAKLLDGGQTEDQFYSFLETGYARRCLFGYGETEKKSYETETAEEIYRKLIQPENSNSVNKWAMHFHKLADPAKYGWRMEVPDPVGIALVAYRIECEKQAEGMADHEEIKKAELNHRYFKALKLAGAFAYVDESLQIEMDHLLSAIKLVEECGISFQRILNREKAYEKLAKYIASVGSEQTHADLVESLPYYPKGNAARNDMMNLATAWGYRRHIIIKKTFVDGIEFYKGETLQETNLDEMIFSFSESWAYNYQPEKQPFDQLHLLTQARQDNGDPLHWANHHFAKGHRAEENVIPNFNMIVIDVDGGVHLDTVHELLREYKFMTYTTKRHTDEEHRFRLLIPINYYLDLDSDEYKEFMNSFMDWLPFPTDAAANQRSKKWETFDGQYHYNLDGELLDALPFIPKTQKNDLYKQGLKELESLDNLERWFAQRIATGNRNNYMIKYALALVDSGMNLLQVSDAVKSFNQKLNNPLSDNELDSTVLVTVAKKYSRT